MIMLMMMMRQEGVSSKPHKTCSPLLIIIADVIIIYSCGKLHPYTHTHTHHTHTHTNNFKFLYNRHARSC